VNVRTSLACAVACASLVSTAAGRAVAADAGAPPTLQAVMVVSRHGVRSQAASGVRDAGMRALVAIPGCPSLDCALASFDAIIATSVDPRFVAPW